MTLLVLWDVDHTLIDNAGVSKETYAAAFELLVGRPAAGRARTNGRTDPEIMRDLLAGEGVDPGRFRSGAIFAALARAMEDKQETLRTRGRALAGGREAIRALASIPGIVQSVLTGNIRANAYVKLSTFDLHHDLDWDSGAYGSDANLRPALVGVAQTRARQRYRSRFGTANTVLIGDTVRDVRAGLDGGARVVAVATGSDSVEELLAEGASTVLHDLADTDAVVSAVRVAGQSTEGEEIG